MAGAIGDPLIDAFLPDPDVRERHQTVVAAPADVTWAAVQDLDFRDSALVRAIFRGRELLMRARPKDGGKAGTFLQQVQALGWRQLAEEPGRKIVFGAVMRPWEANVVFRGLTPGEFLTFDEPDYVKILWALQVEPAGERSVFQHRDPGGHHRRRGTAEVPAVLVADVSRDPDDPAGEPAPGPPRSGTAGGEHLTARNCEP